MVSLNFMPRLKQVGKGAKKDWESCKLCPNPRAASFRGRNLRRLCSLHGVLMLQKQQDWNGTDRLNRSSVTQLVFEYIPAEQCRATFCTAYSSKGVGTMLVYLQSSRVQHWQFVALFEAQNQTCVPNSTFETSTSVHSKTCLPSVRWRSCPGDVLQSDRVY